MMIYLGGGELIGVPARNLTDEEADEHGRQRLVDSGFYVEAAKPKPRENKMAAGPQENKAEV